MKKTKILLVLAIAMLAMFAMSACGLVVAGIEKVEFEVMPKNYFVAEDFAGINVKFNATIGGSVYTVDYTADANVENEKVEISGANLSANVTVKGYPTEMKMGEYTLNVTVEGVSAEYSFRLCDEISTEEELVAAIAPTGLTADPGVGYYILTEDVEISTRVDVTRGFVLYGENFAIMQDSDFDYGNNGDSSKSSMINVHGNNSSYVNNTLFELNNVNIDGTWRNAATRNQADNPPCATSDADYRVIRGFNVNTVEGSTFNFNACQVSGRYSMNFGGGTKNLVVNISEGTQSAGWAALNIWSANSVFNLDSVEMIGVNKYSGESNSFATIVLNGNDGFVGNNNVVNMVNVDIVSVGNPNPSDGGKAVEQAHFSIQDFSENNGGNCANNVVYMEGCRFAVALGGNFTDITSIEQDGLILWNNGVNSHFYVR